MGYIPNFVEIGVRVVLFFSIFWVISQRIPQTPMRAFSGTQITLAIINGKNDMLFIVCIILA